VKGDPVCMLRAIERVIQNLASGFDLRAAVSESASWYVVDHAELQRFVINKALGVMAALACKRVDDPIVGRPVGRKEALEY